MKAQNKVLKYKKIKDTKINTKIEDLCKGLPTEFSDYLNYVRNIEYYDEPKYEVLKNLFKRLFKKIGYKKDYVFDWSTKEKNEVSYSNKS